jgi:hypothetical protein
MDHGVTALAVRGEVEGEVAAAAGATVAAGRSAISLLEFMRAIMDGTGARVAAAGDHPVTAEVPAVAAPADRMLSTVRQAARPAVPRGAPVVTLIRFKVIPFRIAPGQSIPKARIRWWFPT